MPRRSLRLLFLGGLLGFATVGYAQALDFASQKPKRKDALVLANSVIVTSEFLVKMNPDDIKSHVIYKARSQDAPAILQGLIPNGALAVEYTQNISGISFADVGKQLGLAGPLVFVVNGYELTAKQVAKLRIIPEVIGQAQVTKATPEVPLTTVTIELARPKPVVHPPGTVLIR